MVSMTRRVHLPIILYALSALPFAGCDSNPGGGGGSGGPGDGTKRLRIAVIPKGTTHEFWKSIHAGAVKAEREINAEAGGGVRVEVQWKGPQKEDDRSQQIQVVQNFIAAGVQGIVLAPLDANALVRPVQEAKRLGIPTVIFDSGLASEEIVSYVATDNFEAGRVAARSSLSRVVD